MGVGQACGRHRPLANQRNLNGRNNRSEVPSWTRKLDSRIAGIGPAMLMAWRKPAASEHEDGNGP